MKPVYCSNEFCLYYNTPFSDKEPIPIPTEQLKNIINRRSGTVFCSQDCMDEFLSDGRSTLKNYGKDLSQDVQLQVPKLSEEEDNGYLLEEED